MVAGRLTSAILATLVATTLAVSGSRATVEVEHYRSLADMTRAADAVVLGRIVSTEPGRVFAGCGYTAATLEVERVLARRIDVPQPALTIEYFSLCGALPTLGNGIPAERAVFFLRNKGGEYWIDFPDADGEEIERESQYWRRVITAGTIVERDGRTHLPSTYNAPFLQVLVGRPFGDVVGEISRLARLPDTDTTAPGAGSGHTVPSALYALAIASFALATWRQPWRDRKARRR